MPNHFDIPVPRGDDWLALTTAPIALDEITAWATLPRCGAVVSFSGTVRDHSHRRPNVRTLRYEAYEEYAVDRLHDVAHAARRRWHDLGRVALVHRTGLLAVGETAVVVVTSAPHRAEAFEAAAFCIDTLKATVPLWKFEEWDGGGDWATACDHPHELHAP